MKGASAFRRLRVLDSKLAQFGFPALSEWWLSEAERALDHPTAKTWVARVGRGGAKSTAIAKLALSETLFGGWKVPPGERHHFALVSSSRDEAAQRLHLLEAYLRALGVPYDRASDTIDLREAPHGIKVLACQVSAVSGFRSFGFAGDEVAKWRSADDGANPAKEVAASLRAMTVTHKGARAAFFSSPLSSADYHSSLIEQGDTNRQVVSQAPTWVAIRP